MHLHDPDRIPPQTRKTLDDYAKHGISPGDFVRAVLAGDLYLAFARADDETISALPAMVAYVRTLPAGCYGSYQLVLDWMRARAADRRAGSADSR